MTANDYITHRVISVDLKNRLCDIETECCDRLHVWLLRIVGALTAPTSMALPCRWRSRPQHQKRTNCAATSLHRRSPKGPRRSLRKIAEEFMALGYANKRGVPYSASCIKAIHLFNW